mmetsp:Transcript_38110/g.50215  ORF Transcript_38110/g.50215 Transcript_38110/m.50215 type:complete len:444 (-) Transcript_38110:1718-3049(-)
MRRRMQNNEEKQSFRKGPPDDSKQTHDDSTTIASKGSFISQERKTESAMICVAILGNRKIGKTTLLQTIKNWNKFNLIQLQTKGENKSLPEVLAHKNLNDMTEKTDELKDPNLSRTLVQICCHEVSNETYTDEEQCSIVAEFIDVPKNSFPQGQERSGWLEGVAAVLLCFDETDVESFQSLEKKWIPICRRECPQAYLIVVGCKADLAAGDLAALAAELAANESEGMYVSVSQSDERSIRLLSRTLQAFAMQLVNSRELLAEGVYITTSSWSSNAFGQNESGKKRSSGKSNKGIAESNKAEPIKSELQRSEPPIAEPACLSWEHFGFDRVEGFEIDPAGCTVDNIIQEAADSNWVEEAFSNVYDLLEMEHDKFDTALLDVIENLKMPTNLGASKFEDSDSSDPQDENHENNDSQNNYFGTSSEIVVHALSSSGMLIDPNMIIP